MSLRVGAKTKGIIKNNRTGEIRKFQFNPSEFTYSRSVTYATIDAPGMSYPDSQFVKGDIREFNLELFFWDKPFSGLYQSNCNYYGGFLTSERNTNEYDKPPEMTFVIGNWVRQCVMTALEISISDYDSDLNPVQFTLNMTIRQVGV